MRQLPLSHSLLTYLDVLEYTESALSADPETSELADAFRDQIERWEAVFRSERQSRRAVTRAEAVLAVRNACVDTTTTRFGGVALVEARQDRRSPAFQRFFRKAPSELVRQPLRQQCEYTLGVIVAEIEKTPADSPLRAYAAPLRDGATAAIGALDARNQAKTSRATTTNDVVEWKEGVNQLRLSTYAGLLQIAADQGYPRSWADTFFPSAATSADGEPAAPTPPTDDK